MQHVATRLALALTLALAAGAAHGAEPAAKAITLGQQVRGEITSSDVVNWRDGSRSELYAFDLRAGQAVRFSVDGPLRAHLSLFRDGQIESSSGDRDRASLSVRAPAAGRYLLAVSGSDASSFGPFTLSSTALQVYDGSQLAPGASITDWVEGSRRLPLRIDRAGVYAIRMASTEFDTVVSIEGNGLSLSNDDSEGSDSLLSAWLEPGSYTINATGYDGAGRGQYELSVAERELPEGVTVAADGELVAGRELSALYQGRPVAYRLSVPSRQLLELEMRSAELDSRLALEGPGVSMEDDDSGNRLDAKITSVVGPGEYTVRASAFDANGGAGVFTVSARLSAVPADIGGGTLQPGQPRDARLMDGMTDRYTLAIPRAGSYRIEMTSSDGLDAYLRLRRDGEVVAEDDDGGGNLDARIEQALQPGEYVLEASSAMGGQGGRYRIGVQRR